MCFCRYGEEPDYPYNNPPKTFQEFYGGKKIGHFTQVCFFPKYIQVDLLYFPSMLVRNKLMTRQRSPERKKCLVFSLLLDGIFL